MSREVVEVRKRIPLQRVRELLITIGRDSLVLGPLDVEDLTDILVEVEALREGEEGAAQAAEASGT